MSKTRILSIAIRLPVQFTTSPNICALQLPYFVNVLFISIY